MISKGQIYKWGDVEYRIGDCFGSGLWPEKTKWALWKKVNGVETQLGLFSEEELKRLIK